MALYTVSLGRDADHWRIVQPDHELLAGLAAEPRAAAPRVAILADAGIAQDGTLLVLTEGDDWFAALVVDGDGLRAFVSEQATALGSPQAEPYLHLDFDPRYGWAGDPAVLAIFGLAEEVMLEMAEIGLDPALAVAEMADALGVIELVESSR